MTTHARLRAAATTALFSGTVMLAEGVQCSAVTPVLLKDQANLKMTNNIYSVKSKGCLFQYTVLLLMNAYKSEHLYKGTVPQDFKRWPGLVVATTLPQRGAPSSAHLSVRPALVRHFKLLSLAPEEWGTSLSSLLRCMASVLAMSTFPCKKPAQLVINAECNVLQIT